MSGPAWLYQPSVGQLAGAVVAAALDVSPRTLLDLREAIRYWTALMSRVVKFHGGLVLRAVITTDLPVQSEAEEEYGDKVRSIA
ncbi:MAG TPA: hypothetical protein VFP72_03060 [Kineosporiaceae bacterium]|nr:hypothetical protein [Kineosporiaceae bacterium]